MVIRKFQKSCFGSQKSRGLWSCPAFDRRFQFPHLKNGDSVPCWKLWRNETLLTIICVFLGSLGSQTGLCWGRTQVWGVWALGYLHGGLKSQNPHLMLGLWPDVKNCRLNPSRSLFSSVEWISSPLVTLLGRGPKDEGRELALPPLACS